MQSTLERDFENISASPLSPYREKAWAKFVERGLPAKKEDAFRYFPLRRLYEAETPLTTTARVSSNGAISLPLEEAMQTYQAVIDKALNSAIAKENNPFVLAQIATHASWQFFYVPPGKTAEITTNNHACALIFIGRGAKVEWTHRGESGSLLSSAYTFQEAGSSLEVSLDYGNVAGWHLDGFRFALKRDARLELYSFSQGGEGMRHDLDVDLLEENAQAKLCGLHVLKDKREHHNFVRVRHAAPSCRSHQHFKTVVFDKAKTSFEGKIFVESEAQQTEAYQLCNHLVLGEGAIANSKPNLEIFADDVKASHGATVTQIAPEELFYLQSRGVDSKTAKELLIRGFCAAFFAEAPKSLQDYDV